MPALFSLKDLMDDPYHGYYYEKQLTRCPAPDFKRDFFSVEKVISKKVINKKKFYLVKFLFYPSKFNQYIPESNMKIGNE